MRCGAFGSVFPEPDPSIARQNPSVPWWMAVRASGLRRFLPSFGNGNGRLEQRADATVELLNAYEREALGVSVSPEDLATVESCSGLYETVACIGRGRADGRCARGRQPASARPGSAVGLALFGGRRCS